ncbi:MAG TPA: thioesterase family protein [Aestuariivirgaceae bacterium]|nr:thioesterase family protein [Aestuariivirgaceae bacterium]
MNFPAPFIGRTQEVESQWIDYNGHFNMAYYNVIFDRCGDEAFALMGLGPDYVAKTNCSFFTLEAHITYLRELRARDPVRVTVQFLDYDSKRVHYVQEMFHADEGWLSCVTENIVMHVDMAAKKSAPFPSEVLEKIKSMHQAHKPLPVPPQVGHRIAIPKKG